MFLNINLRFLFLLFLSALPIICIIYILQSRKKTFLDNCFLTLILIYFIPILLGYETSAIEVEESNNSSFIVGLIEIKKLKIIYPILSDVSDDLLKIATCRFYGPMPNEVGNLCIAAHNYHDYRFFSRINLLEIGDSINIYDSYGNVLEYLVTSKYTIDAYDNSCTNQNTNGEKQITLLTCNNVTGYRLVVKATAIA